MTKANLKQMAKADLVEMEGKIVEVCKGGMFQVVLDGGDHQVQAKLSGRLRHFKIKIVEGDRVILGMSPYDSSLGLITRRL